MLLLENFWLLFVDSAPFLLVGMLIAGLINQFVPTKQVEKHLGKSSGVLRASLIGAPLPLCSCSVIPVAMGIRRSGASKASTASFLVATPETGVDSVGITYALMGPVMAIARPLSAIFSAVIAGSAVKYFDTEVPATDTPVKKSCCGGKKASAPQSFLQRFQAACQYGFGKLLRDFMKWLLIGLFFAAVIKTFVPEQAIAEYGSGVMAMVVVIIISIPMYICATASTPIAAGLMLSGVSPGAALVFMLTGPATNIATLMVIKNELGLRSLALYLTAVISSAIISGLALDAVVDALDLSFNLSHGVHGDMTSYIYTVAALVLAALLVFQGYKKYKA
ncbi:MAG: SO_0444 family Cu/Zn efflux transporter [Pontibacterium sp.]